MKQFKLLVIINKISKFYKIAIVIKTSNNNLKKKIKKLQIIKKLKC